MKNFKVIAKAPTSYQYQSLRHFGTPKSNGDGSYSVSVEFETEEEAKNYLKERAGYYFEYQEELEQAEKDIDNGHSITMDAVSGGVFEEERPRTQKELGRKNWVLKKIIVDSDDLKKELESLKEFPEGFINSIYEISYDEMTEGEREECIEWIEKEIKSW